MTRPEPLSDTGRLSHTLADGAFMLAACLALVLPLFTPGEGGIEPLGLVYSVALIALAMAGVSLALSDGPSLLRTGMGGGWLLYAAAVVLGVACAAARRDALLGSFQTLVPLAPLAILALTLPRNAAARRASARLLLWGMFGALALTMLYGLYQYVVVYPVLIRQAHDDPLAVQIAFGIRDPRLWQEFLDRVHSRQIYSTFLLSNTFAGYLAVWCPVAIGLALDAGRLRRRGADASARRAGLLLHGAAIGSLALLAVNIVLTESRGGWAALAVALPVFWVMGRWARVRPWLRRLWWLAVPAGVGMIVVTALVCFTDSLGVGPITSMVFRLGYWRGTLSVIGHSVRHAVFGVGPDNFKTWYTALKPAASQEVGTPHNDYLSILVGFGIVGLAGFLWAWLGFVRRAWRMPAEAEPASAGSGKTASARAPFPKRRFVALCAAVALTMLLVPLTTGLFEGDSALRTWFWVVAIPLVGGGALTLAWRMERDGQALPSTWTRRGIVAGLVAFWVHIIVDFDWELPGVAVTVTLLAALYVALSRQTTSGATRPLSRPAAVGVGVGAAVLAVVAYLWAVSPTIATRSLAERAAAHRQAWMLAVNDPAAARRRGDTPDSLRRRLIEETLPALAERAQADRGDGELWKEMAQIYELLWRDTGGDGLRRQAIEAMEAEEALRPVHYAIPHRIAIVYRDAARQEADASGRRALFDTSLSAYRRAIERYPTLPGLVLDYARTLREAGHAEAARDAYRHALTLDGQITQSARFLTNAERREAQGYVEGYW